MKVLKKLTLFILVLVINISVVNAGVKNKLDDLATYSKDVTDLKYLYVYDCEIEPDINYYVTDYNVVCPTDTKNLKMTYRARSVYSNVEVIGNDIIHNGSVVKVKITAEQGQEKFYNFTVRYSNSKLVYIILLVLISVILILAIVNLVLYILYKKGVIKLPKKKKENIGEESYVN